MGLMKILLSLLLTPVLMTLPVDKLLKLELLMTCMNLSKVLHLMKLLIPFLLSFLNAKLTMVEIQLLLDKKVFPLMDFKLDFKKKKLKEITQPPKLLVGSLLLKEFVTIYLMLALEVMILIIIGKLLTLIIKIGELLQLFLLPCNLSMVVIVLVLDKDINAGSF